MDVLCLKCNSLIGFQPPGKEFVSTCPVALMESFFDVREQLCRFRFVCGACYKQLEAEKRQKEAEQYVKDNLDKAGEEQWQKFLAENPLT